MLLCEMCVLQYATVPQTPFALDLFGSQMHDSCLDLKAGLRHCTLMRHQSQCSPRESQWAPTVQGARSST